MDEGEEVDSDSDRERPRSCCLSTRPARRSVHWALWLRDFLPRSRRRKAPRRPRLGTSEAGWVGRVGLRKRNWMGKSSSRRGVAEFLDARWVMVVKGWSSLIEDPPWWI